MRTHSIRAWTGLISWSEINWPLFQTLDELIEMPKCELADNKLVEKWSLRSWFTASLWILPFYGVGSVCQLTPLVNSPTSSVTSHASFALRANKRIKIGHLRFYLSGSHRLLVCINCCLLNVRCFWFNKSRVKNITHPTLTQVCFFKPLTWSCFLTGSYR